MKISLVLLSIWLFYCQFAGAISVYRLWMKKKLNLWNECLYFPMLVVFFIIDVIINWTALLVLGIPPRGCTTMSDRFQVYHTGLNLDGTPYSASKVQKDVGVFICEKLLNPVDPTGNHC